jgi:hypothetical protein
VVGEIDRAVASLADDQHGVVSRAQVIELGGGPNVARRRVASGHWREVAPGVVLIGAGPRTFERDVQVALLAAVASHRTAARLWGLGERSSLIELTVPHGRSHDRRGVRTHTSRDLDRAHVSRRSSLPVTGAARTILDLGAVQPHRVRRAVWAGLRSSVVSWPSLLDTLVVHARRGRAGVGPLRAILAEHYGELATDSTTEDVAFEILVDSGRVPSPDKQVPVVCADGVPVTIDLGWPDFRALVEVFGVDHLTNEDLQHLDLHRRNQIELAGYRLLVYSGRLLERQPDQFVADVEALLRAGGWTGA